MEKWKIQKQQLCFDRLREIKLTHMPAKQTPIIYITIAITLKIKTAAWHTHTYIPIHIYTYHTHMHIYTYILDHCSSISSSIKCILAPNNSHSSLPPSFHSTPLYSSGKLNHKNLICNHQYQHHTLCTHQ